MPPKANAGRSSKTHKAIQEIPDRRVRMKKIKKVGVLGCGLMGSGIAEVAARSGYETVVREVTEELVDKGIQKIGGSLGKAVERGKLEASAADETLSRLSATAKLQHPA